MRLVSLFIVALSFASLTTFVPAQAPSQTGDSSTTPLRVRWEVPTVIDVRSERLVQDIAWERTQRSKPAIPQFRSIIADGHLFMRTPRRVMAVDYETGKRIWEYPWYESQFDDSPRETRGDVDYRDQLERKLWNDAPYASLTAGDGYLFALDKVGPIPGRRDRRRPVLRLGARAGRRSVGVSNELVAMDINSQGKLMWIVGGESGDEPPLAGGYFLSSGCIHEGILYVVVELEEKLQLAALVPKTGEMKWSLTLAELEEDDLLENFRLRRIAAVTPVVVGGRLICPTALGKVVAIDIERREVAWETSSWPKPMDGEDERPRPRLVSQGNRWLDNAVLPAGDVVIVTPMDSQQLYCLDVDTGKVQWQMAREDRLFAAVEGDVCLLIGEQGVEARNTRSGTPLWEGLAFPAKILPSGRGVFDGGHYLLPTTDGKVLSINCRQGKSSVVAVTESPLGNLLLHDGELISTGYDHVRTFPR
jgi:outer membrane protein assembly factor BamB